MEWLQIINIPILQGLGIIVLIGIAERVGIPVVSILKNVLKMNGTSGDIPSWARSLIDKQEQLGLHYNDETTQKLEDLIDLGKKSLEIQDKNNQLAIKHEAKLDEILKYGVPCRDKQN